MGALRWLTWILISAVLLFQSCTAIIDTAVLHTIYSNDHKTADVLIHFAGGNSQVIKNIESKSYKDRPTKVKALVSDLKTHSERMHTPVEDYLESNGLSCRKYWASNQMITENITLEQLHKVASFPHVARIQELPVVTLTAFLNGAAKPFTLTAAGSNVSGWGVSKTQSDQVWRDFGTKGEKVTVANIDTGVLFQHEALQDRWRSDHGWFDPYDATETPNDGNGHGTHTMGIIAGTHGIGVAPAATWIACRGCGTSSCQTQGLMACGEWMMAPTDAKGKNPDPSKAPHIVSNSWGSSGGNAFYDPIVAAWTAAGILSVFSIGNSGPGCNTAGSPGDRPGVFSCGSTNQKNQISSYSSKGPATDTSIKPDIVAPGEKITSSWPTSPSSYNTISGTSMAAPVVAGVMALMVSAKHKDAGPDAHMDQSEVTQILTSTTDTKGLALGTRCGKGGTILSNLLSTHDDYPNDMAGAGIINAWEAVAQTMANDINS